MANGSFDVALGRECELFNRVDGNDPANSALILVVLANTGLEEDAVLRTYATLAALLAGTSNEVTNVGYARKTLTDANLTPYTVDTVNHQIVLPLADQTFTTISSGDSWRKLLVCYDSDTTSGTDANIVPVCYQDILVNGVAAVPNGNNILIGFGNGILVAS
jgi:hypothetical protein